MMREPHQSPVRGIVLALLVCASAMISSCSTVNTFLSDLSADSFAAGDKSKDRKIPLPPMVEDFGSPDAGAAPPLDGKQ